MIDHRTAPYAVFILRLSMGLLFLVHAGQKLFVFTPAGTVKYFASLGLPEWFAYAIILLEVVGGLALVLGVYARAAALILAAELLGTIVMVHGANGFAFSNPRGGWEFPAFWAVALVVSTFLGDGAYALRPTFAAARREGIGG
jgi:putative oxidoreductase